MSEESQYNAYTKGRNPKKAILTTGIAYNYLMEVAAKQLDASVLKVTQYPLPKALIDQMVADGAEEILVMEEGQPVVEELLRGMVPSTLAVKGRLTGDLPRMGELTPDCVRRALMGDIVPDSGFQIPEIVVGRPPALCQGCGHRDMYEYQPLQTQPRILPQTAENCAGNRSQWPQSWGAPFRIARPPCPGPLCGLYSGLSGCCPCP